MQLEKPDIANKPEVRELIAQTDSIVAEFADYKIVNAQQYTSSGDDLRKIKGAMKRLEDMELSITRPLNATLAAVRNLFKAPKAKLAAAESIHKRALIAFQEEQERIRREEQRAAEAAAEAERQRIAKQRAEAEAVAREKEAELRRKAEEAAAAGRAEEAARLAARADTVEQKAAVKSEELAERAASVVAPVIQREAPKVAGISTRGVWKWRIKDEKLVPREYLMIDEKRVGAVVRALKLDARIPGIEAYEEKSVAASTA